MPLKPPPRMQQDPSPTPDSTGSFGPIAGDAGDQTTQSQQPEPAQADPGALQDAQNILLITAAARRLAMKYPAAVPDVQTINDAVQKLQMKIQMVQPPAEVAAPPQ